MTKERSLRILIADDHALLRMGLASLIERQADMTVVGMAENGERAVAVARETRPDVVVLDLMMPVLGGAEAVARLGEEVPSARVLVLTSFGTSGEVLAAVRNGAVGAMMKDDPNDELLAAIRSVARGERHFDAVIRQFVEEADGQPVLNGRQLELLRAAELGYNTNEIAERLDLTPDGVKKGFRRICDVLDAANRIEAVAIAVRRGLIGR